MLKKKLAWALCALFLLTPVMAVAAALKDNHPQRYTVQPGDTLWDISARFLKNPWYWPEIWYENPDIDNPHLIYPGDVIKLTYVNGKPRLSVQRGGGTVKLSPKVRVEDLDQAIHTIPMSAIRPFLTGARVVSQDEYSGAPYIVAGADERVMGATGDPIYVRKLPSNPANSWDIARKGKPFVDPETGERLGFEAIQVGAAHLKQRGDPATFMITSINREVLPGDRLFQVKDTELRSRFYPSAPDTRINGLIMAVLNGVSQIGQYDVVALNRGRTDGLKVGNVLEIYKRGRTVKDEYASDGDKETVTLPDEKAGELIVFRVFDRMSFGLVMQGSRAMTVDDLVRSP